MSEFLFALLPVALMYLGYSIHKALKYDRPHDKPKEAKNSIDGPVKYPGYMPYKDSHGCYVAEFSNVSAMNAYFEPNNAGYLKSVVEILPTQWGTILCVYTNVMTNEMLEEIQEWSYEKHAHFAAKKEAKLALEMEEYKKQEQLKQDALHYEDLGRKYAKRTNNIKLLAPGSLERKEAEAKLNKGEVDE